MLLYSCCNLSVRWPSSEGTGRNLFQNVPGCCCSPPKEMMWRRWSAGVAVSAAMLTCRRLTSDLRRGRVRRSDRGMPSAPGFWRRYQSRDAGRVAGGRGDGDETALSIRRRAKRWPVWCAGRRNRAYMHSTLNPTRLPSLLPPQRRGGTTLPGFSIPVIFVLEDAWVGTRLARRGDKEARWRGRD